MVMPGALPRRGAAVGPTATPVRSGPVAGRVRDPAGDDADAELVARLATRDTGALDALYARHGRPAYSLARRICVDVGLAEDVVQEVFLALWRDPDRFDPRRGSVVSWLLTLVHHKSVDAVRREATRRRHHVSTDSPEEGATPAGSADRAALGQVIGEQVRSALGRLPEEQRRALGLAYYGGYTQREVATLTGVPIGTVKSRMFAGVARLRVLLGPVLGTSALDLFGDAA